MKILTPKFETKRLILRELEVADAPAYQMNFNDYEVIKFLSDKVPWPYPDDGAEYYIKNFVRPSQGIDRWDWGIFLKDNPTELIGSLSIFHPGLPEHRGFWLGKKYWGKGLMTEAVKPTMDFAFNTLKLDSMIFANAVENNRSRRVKEKTSAKFLDVRPSKFVMPQYTQSEYWTLTKEEWEKSKA